MTLYEVAEKFISINGEGRLAGRAAVFIRFKGCNLNCSYCDTKWANNRNLVCEKMTGEEIYSYIKSTGIRSVTLTGGEPLLQKDIYSLLEVLCGDDFLKIEIETNGSVSIEPFLRLKNRPSFTLDYKTPSSGMEEHMLLKNYSLIDERDTVKFVCGSREDLERAKSAANSLKLTCPVYLSPVFGKIDPAEIVDFIIENKMNNVNLQLQLHKFIWDPDKRGV